MINTFKRFVQSEQIGGILLIGCTVISLLISNTGHAEWYSSIWKIKLGLTLEHWINDGLMAVFFLFVGLEIKREVTDGELSSMGKATMPLISAIGGMVLPAAIFLIFNYGEETVNGWGIPMATDIAFAIAVISFLGKRVPLTLKVFLVAVAVVDDLGAIMVIAIFYAQGFSWAYFIASLIVFGLLIAMNLFGVKKLSYYLILGAVLWFLILQTGIHATIAGVLLAFTIPWDADHDKSLLHNLEHALARPVGLIVMPLFALANTAISLQGDLMGQLNSSESLGIILGLVVGKPLGIILMALLVVKLNLGSIPQGVNWTQLTGAAFLGGIGFTMSIFIANLAYADLPQFIEASKISILTASLLAAAFGFLLLLVSSKKSSNE